MNTTRLWVFGTIVLALGVIIVGWLVGIEPKLREVADAEVDRANAAQQNETNELILADLKERYASLGELEEQLEELQLSVPFRSEFPKLLDELNDIAETTGVALTEVIIDEARPYGSPPPAPEAVVEEPAAEGDAPAEEPAAPVEPAVPAPVLSPPTVTDPLITSQNFVAIPMAMSVQGSYATILEFVDAVQSSKRLILVISLGIAPEGTPEEDEEQAFTGVLAGVVYVLLDPIGEAAIAK